MVLDFFSESIGIFGAAGVSGLYQPVFVYYPPDEPESEIGKNLSGEQRFLCKNKDKWNFAENRICKNEMPERGKALFRHY